MPITIEFTVNDGEKSFKEDSVTLASPEELFEFVSPGGGCDHMPSDLGEIQMIFLPREHPNVINPIADKRVTLRIGIIVITGPLATIVQVSEELIDKFGRGELSEAFLAAAAARY